MGLVAPADRRLTQKGTWVDPNPGRRPRAGASILTLLAGALLGVLPFTDIRLENALSGVALETCAGLVALLAAYLALGRFMRSGRLSDLALLCSLSMLAGGNVLFGAVPTIVSPAVNDALSIWAATTTSTIGALALLGSAWLSKETVDDRRRAAELALGGVAALLFLISAIAVGFEGSIPPSISVRDLMAHPLALILQAAGVFFFAVAALGFFRRAERDNDGFMRWVEAAAILAAFAHLNYLLHPITDPHWVYTGDLMKLGSYFLLTIGAAREIADYWGERERSAQLEERRRLARDMHDGLAQELAYIARLAQLLQPSIGDTRAVERICASTERALSETRRAIAALTDTSSEPLEVALTAEVQNVSERSDATLWLNLAQNVDVSLAERDTLLRIAREATVNAVEHGGARRVVVELWKRGRHTCLRISDDGSGFDTESSTEDAFGLISMRERVDSMGGNFLLTSSPGRGTEIEVTLP